MVQKAPVLARPSWLPSPSPDRGSLTADKECLAISLRACRTRRFCMEVDVERLAVDKVDIRKAEATVLADLDMIRAKIQGSIGLEEFNMRIQEQVMAHLVKNAAHLRECLENEINASQLHCSIDDNEDCVFDLACLKIMNAVNANSPRVAPLPVVVVRAVVRPAGFSLSLPLLRSSRGASPH